MHPLIYVPRQRLWVPSDLGDTPPRGRGNCDGTIAGAGAGAGFGGGRWTPASVPGCLLWQGSYRDDRATLNTQPVLLDGDMEAAGVAAWTAVGTGAMTKESVNPFAGAQWLKAASSGAASYYATQNVLITGNRYAAAGVGKSDGTKIPEIWLNNAKIWTGTNATSWQPIAADGTADGIKYYAGGTTAVIGYTGFDSLTLSNISLNKYTPAYVAPAYAGTVLQQATATAMPWRSSDGLGIRYQAGDYEEWSAATSAAQCLHDGSGGTLIIVLRPSVLAATNYYLGTCTAATGTGILLAYTNANALILRVSNGTGAYDIDASAAATIAINTTYVLTLRIVSGVNGATIRQNGVTRLTAALTAPNVAAASNALRIGAHTMSVSSVDGTIPDHALYNRVLTDAECLQVERDMYFRATGTAMP